MSDFEGGWLVLTVIKNDGQEADTQTFRLTDHTEVNGRATFVAVDEDGDRYVLTEEVE